MAEQLPTDPSELTPIEPPWPENMLFEIADFDLRMFEHTLTLACGRNKTVTQEKHRKYICSGLRAVTAERTRRKLPPIA
jgi:hypothetical protein